MSVLKVLDAADPVARAEWLARWTAWPEQEPMAHPAYVALFAGPGERALCAIWGEPGSGALYPFILRPIGATSWAAGAPEWDLVTPYGYGGVFACGMSPGPLPAFWDALDTWLRAHAVVSSFARLSLFEQQILPYRGDVQVTMPNVVRRLDLPLDAIWSDYAHKVRKNVNAARRNQLVVEIDERAARLDEFLAIYESTMDRRNAAEGYYFDRAFFETIATELRGHHLFVHVLHAGEVVSTELVLRSCRHLYSFLGGTREAAFALRPNDLLKHAVVEWGHAKGMQAYVLGGGYGGPDGIFKYKLAFAPGGEVPFRTARAVHDVAAYDRLTAVRRAFEVARGAAWAPRPGFFPEYRG